jgi:ABC-type multidrug transport system fused ATPase/permease subunit
MENAMKGRTTFVIAHRLSTLKTADLILVLHRGRIVQSGTHDQLMDQDGAYRLAARLQVADDTSRMLLGMGKEVAK